MGAADAEIEAMLAAAEAEFAAAMTYTSRSAGAMNFATGQRSRAGDAFGVSARRVRRGDGWFRNAAGGQAGVESAVFSVRASTLPVYPKAGDTIEEPAVFEHGGPGSIVWTVNRHEVLCDGREYHLYCTANRTNTG